MALNRAAVHKKISLESIVFFIFYDAKIEIMSHLEGVSDKNSNFLQIKIKIANFWQPFKRAQHIFNDVGNFRFTGLCC